MYIAGKGQQLDGPGTSLQLFSTPNYRVAGGSPGLGCACKGGGSGGMGCGCAKSGMGLFEAGTDFTQWGIPEWSIVGLGFYMVVSTVFTTGRAVGAVRRAPGERRKKKAARLRAEASALTKKSKGGWF